MKEVVIFITDVILKIFSTFSFFKSDVISSYDFGKMHRFIFYCHCAS